MAEYGQFQVEQIPDLRLFGLQAEETKAGYLTYAVILHGIPR